MKNICVFGSSSESIDKKYLFSAESLGKALAKRGMTLIFGAGKYGVMGAAARGAKSENGKLIGVSPDFFVDFNVLDNECTELIFTPTMRERKAIMEDKADAFIICAGGIGTFEEFFEVLTLKQLRRHDKPIIIYNVGGYYDSMLDMMSKSADEKFMSEKVSRLYTIAESEDEIFEQLENYIPYTFSKY
ncbi:MAG TPA: TIGR00730 family Rossman fold protein [Ruminococcaceae bacterium]|nr:TIGR00730 family Rossman fold protein [Oscillospiraceae bacterium]